MVTTQARSSAAPLDESANPAPPPDRAGSPSVPSGRAGSPATPPDVTETLSAAFLDDSTY